MNLWLQFSLMMLFPTAALSLAAVLWTRRGSENSAAASTLALALVLNGIWSSGIAANKGLSPKILKKVRQALVDFQPKGRDKAYLYHWKMTEMPGGFIEAHSIDYEELRDWAAKFGLLSEAEKGHTG